MRFTQLLASSGGKAVGSIVGGVVGAFGAIIIVCLLIGLFIFLRKKKRNKEEDSEPAFSTALTNITTNEPESSNYSSISGNLLSRIIPRDSTLGGEKTWEIVYSQISLQHIIGEGEYGAVYKAEWREGEVGKV